MWPNHEAEHEIGLEYEQIDVILYCILDKNLSLEDTAKQADIEIGLVTKIHQMYQNSEHKRVNPKALWIGIIFTQIR